MENSWKSLINCEVNLILTWSSTCVINNSTWQRRFTITDLIVILPNQDTVKLLQQLKSGFKRTINWSKYQSDPKAYAQNQYLNDLIDPSLEEVNRPFVLSFENEDDIRSHSNYYFPKVEVIDYNVMIDGKNLSDQPINNHFKTYENIIKIVTGQRDHRKNWLFVRLYLFLKKL